MRHKRLIIIAATALVVSACSTSGGSETTTSTDPGSVETTSTIAPSTTATTVPLAGVPTQYSDYLQQETACGGAAPEPLTEMQFDAPGEAAVSGSVVVTLDTSCGPIEIELDAAVAPETVNSFVFLAEEGYFDGSASHRIIPGFMMQAGDPTATGRGGPGYFLRDELPESGDVYQRGVVAMANAGPNSGGSQFFILFDEAPWLPPSYSVFGTVTSGFETLDAIETISLGQNPLGGDPSPSVPLESLFIYSVDVSR